MLLITKGGTNHQILNLVQTSVSALFLFFIFSFPKHRWPILCTDQPTTYTCSGHSCSCIHFGLTLKQVLGTSFDLCPLTATTLIMSSSMLSVAFTTLLARHVILRKWKHASPPTHNGGIQEMLECKRLEKIRFSRNSRKPSLRLYMLHAWDWLICLNIHKKGILSSPIPCTYFTDATCVLHIFFSFSS